MRPKHFRTANEQWLPLAFLSASVPGGVSCSTLLPGTVVSDFLLQDILLRYCKSVLKKPAPSAPSAGPSRELQHLLLPLTCVFGLGLADVKRVGLC